MAKILFSDKTLEALVVGRLQHELMAEAEQHIAEAVKNYESALREKIGVIVLKLMTQYSVERRGEELHILVRATDIVRRP